MRNNALKLSVTSHKQLELLTRGPRGQVQGPCGTCIYEIPKVEKPTCGYFSCVHFNIFYRLNWEENK